MSTILIGVEDSTRSKDAVAFARRLAAASGGRVVVAAAFPYDDQAGRAANLAYRDALRTDADRTARRMSERLEGIPADRVHTVTVARTSPAHALHDVAVSENAAIVVVGSTHTGHAGRVFPGSTAERLLHGAPCAVAVVPDGYRSRTEEPIHRIGVAYNGSTESTAALAAAHAAASALHARLVVIAVVDAELYTAPALMGGPSTTFLHDDVVAHVRGYLDAAMDTLPEGTDAESVLLEGDPARMLTEASEQLDLLVIGSRGYGPLRAVLAGGVSGRVTRTAHCPVIVVPRGVEAPLAELVGNAAEAAA